MQSNSASFIHAVFFLLFIATLIGGGLLIANFERLFGGDPEMPSENSSARSYGKMQALVVWLHLVVLTGAFAFLMH